MEKSEQEIKEIPPKFVNSFKIDFSQYPLPDIFRLFDSPIETTNKLSVEFETHSENQSVKISTQNTFESSSFSANNLVEKVEINFHKELNFFKNRISFTANRLSMQLDLSKEPVEIKWKDNVTKFWLNSYAMVSIDRNFRHPELTTALLSAFSEDNWKNTQVRFWKEKQKEKVQERILNTLFYKKNGFFGCYKIGSSFGSFWRTSFRKIAVGYTSESWNAAVHFNDDQDQSLLEFKPEKIKGQVIWQSEIKELIGIEATYGVNDHEYNINMTSLSKIGNRMSIRSSMDSKKQGWLELKHIWDNVQISGAVGFDFSASNLHRMILGAMNCFEVKLLIEN